MALYIATHKAPDPRFPSTLTYILASAALPELAAQGKYMTDRDSTDHIAFKNDTYSELTCLYALHQLVKEGKRDDSIIGLYHYRRYLTERVLYSKLMNLLNRMLEPRLKAIPYGIMDAERAEALLRTEHTIILPKPNRYRLTMEQQYCKHHNPVDLEVALQVVVASDPSFAQAVAQFRAQKHLYCYNLFIMRKDLFCAYADWLFDMLARIEPRISSEARTGYQKRVPAFLAERLFNIWLNHHAHRLTVLEKEVLLFEGAW
jgi:hypothetical protein